MESESGGGGGGQRNRWQQEFYGSAQLAEHKRRPAGFGHFRYVVGALVICAVALNTYANYTIYIAAIEMVSNDVIQSGLTELRAKHLSADPLAANRNAGAPGTCPVESLPGLFESGQEGPAGLNASQLSAIERVALQLDSSALLSSVRERLANGQLVDWTISQRGYIFTAHNIGGILWAVPISRLGLIYGSKLMIFICTLVTGLRMLALPQLAGHSPFWLTFLFELLFGGPGASVAILAYPVAAVWLLPHEANLFVAIAQLVSLMAMAATNFISTQLLAHQIDWCWCYYLPGSLLCIVTLLWWVLAADRPSESRFVSREELDLLANSMTSRNEAKILAGRRHEAARNAKNAWESEEMEGRAGAGAGTSSPREGHERLREQYISCFCEPAQRDRCPATRMERKPNWATIFTCPTVWALIAVFFSYHWNAKIATLWPTYFTNILHLDASTIGVIIGLKGVVALLFGSTFVYLTRKLVVRRPFNMSLTAYRRTNQVLATLVLAASVGLMVLLDCDFWANLASVLLTQVVTSFNTISHEQMPLDLSAEDSGLLVSVVRLLSIGDIIALPASSYILSFAPDALAGDRLTWRLVWLLGLAIKILACLFFVLVAQSKPKVYSRLVPAGPCRTATAPLSPGQAHVWPAPEKWARPVVGGGGGGDGGLGR